MIKKFAKHSIAVALLAGFGVVAGVAQAQERVYVIDQAGAVTKSGADLCWRTGYWTPAAAANDPAGCECDRDLLPKEKCDGVAPAAARTAPSRVTTTVTPEQNKVTLNADALFDFDKAVLRPEGKASLDEVVAKSKELKLEVILAVGHTDRIGRDAYNQSLSERRAAAVKTYLVSKGIEANRVYTEGKGKTQPVTGDQCKKMGAENRNNKKLIECLQPDRRVEIEMIGTK